MRVAKLLWQRKFWINRLKKYSKEAHGLLFLERALTAQKQLCPLANFSIQQD
jgi:hypothetical protein